MTVDASRIARRFPLVARPRPTCPPLAERVSEISELAATAERDGDLARAAAAQNKAALIVSDCGLPDLARTLCRQQSEVYLRAQPLGAQAARNALEPLVNLARLRLRDGQADDAYQLLDTLFRAVKARSGDVIDGRLISFRNLTDSEQDHQDVVTWLWSVLLADGTRALAGAGRWPEALSHVQQHKGIGRRLLDGRQVAILTSVFSEPETALQLLRESAPDEEWEETVAACLTVLALTLASRPTVDATATMVEHCLRQPPPGLMVFHTRTALTALDLAGSTRASAGLLQHLVQHVTAAEDGYAARDLLAHGRCAAQLRQSEKQALQRSVSASALGTGMPRDLKSELLTTARTSRTTTASILGGARCNT